MKKIAIALVLVGVAAFGTSSMTPAAKADGAVIIDVSGACGMFDGNGNFVIATSGQVVITPSGNGNLVCQATVTPSSSGHAVRFDADTQGVPCQTLNGSTDKWQETVSADGSATLTCHTQHAN